MVIIRVKGKDYLAYDHQLTTCQSQVISQWVCSVLGLSVRPTLRHHVCFQNIKMMIAITLTLGFHNGTTLNSGYIHCFIMTMFATTAVTASTLASFLRSIFYIQLKMILYYFTFTFPLELASTTAAPTPLTLPLVNSCHSRSSYDSWVLRTLHKINHEVAAACCRIIIIIIIKLWLMCWCVKCCSSLTTVV